MLAISACGYTYVRVRACWGKNLPAVTTLPSARNCLAVHVFFQQLLDRRATSGDIILSMPPQMDIFLAARKQCLKRKSISRTHTTSIFKRLALAIHSTKLASKLSFVVMTLEAAYPRIFEPFNYSIYTPERFRSLLDQCSTCLQAAAKARLK